MKFSPENPAEKRKEMRDISLQNKIAVQMTFLDYIHNTQNQIIEVEDDLSQDNASCTRIDIIDLKNKGIRGKAKLAWQELQQRLRTQSQDILVPKSS